MAKRSSVETRKLDDAARAGWMYYVAGKTQEEIAKKLNVSRQSAQRMVALSVSEGLIKVRLEHPIAKCMDLKVKLKKRFGLNFCRVVPSVDADPLSTLGLAQAGASVIELHLRSPEPTVLAMGTGRVLRACVDELSIMNCEQHQIVALLGNMASNGSASSYDVVMHMAEHIKAKHYPMPLPVLSLNKKDKEKLHNQHHIANNLKLAEQADVTFVGVGNLGLNSPLHQDGFVMAEEINDLQKQGAVGEIIGWIFDKNGSLLNCEVNERVASTPLIANPSKPVYAIAAGEEKVFAILGALRSKFITGLITNEYTAERLLTID